MSIVLAILVLVMGVIVHKIYASCVTEYTLDLEVYLQNGFGVLLREDLS